MNSVRKHLLISAFELRNNDESEWAVHLNDGAFSLSRLRFKEFSEESEWVPLTDDGAFRLNRWLLVSYQSKHSYCWPWKKSKKIYIILKSRAKIIGCSFCEQAEKTPINQYIELRNNDESVSQLSDRAFRMLLILWEGNVNSFSRSNSLDEFLFREAIYGHQFIPECNVRGTLTTLNLHGDPRLFVWSPFIAIRQEFNPPEHSFNGEAYSGTLSRLKSP